MIIRHIYYKMENIMNRSKLGKIDPQLRAGCRSGCGDSRRLEYHSPVQSRMTPDPNPVPLPTPPSPTPTPEIPPAPGGAECKNCYSHCSNCFTGVARSAIASGADFQPVEGSPGSNDGLLEYFDPPFRIEEGTAATLERGDFVRWFDADPASSSANHCGIANGTADEVSQFGYPLEYWTLRSKQKAAELNADEKQQIDNFHNAPSKHFRMKAGELTPLIYDRNWRKKNPGKKPSYLIYRIKDKYRHLMLCEHSQHAVLGLKYKDISKNPYPGGVLYTDYQLRYSLKQSAPVSKDLGQWTGPFRLLGGHTHYGWEGWATIEIPLDWLQSSSEGKLRAYAEQFAYPPGQRNV